MALSATLPVPPEQEPSHGRELLRAEGRAALVLVVVLGIAGVPVGLLWSLLAPRPDVVPVDGGLQYVDTESKDFIAGDATLFLLFVAAGVVSALLCLRLARRRPLGTVVGLVLGALFGAWVASRTGLIGGESRSSLLAAARAGRITGPTDLPLQLRARTVLLAWPAVAALAFTALSLRRGLPDLVRRT